jgi:YidC/Oxa1 family membrane protein insertase
MSVLILSAVWMTWLQLFPPTPAPAPTPPAAVEGATTPTPGEVAGLGGVAAPGEASAAIAAPPDRVVTVDLCGARAEVASSDGRVRDLQLTGLTDAYAVTPLYAWVLSGLDGPWKPYGDDPGPAQLLSKDARGLIVGAGPLDTPPAPVEIEETPDGVLTRGRTAQGLVVERELRRVADDSCATGHNEVVVRWRNEGSAPIAGGTWIGMLDTLPAGTGGYGSATRPVIGVDGDLDYRQELDDIAGEETIAGASVDVVGLGAQYVGTYLSPVDAHGQPMVGGEARFYRQTVRGEGGAAAQHGAFFVLPEPLGPGATREATFAWYAGDKSHAHLEATDPRLGSVVELGFFSFFALPLLWFMRLIHGVLGDWALSIIALTFLVKLAFYRLTAQSFVAGQKMQAIQPELAALKVEFADNPEELNRRTMLLFQEKQVNPLGGCFPMLFQMPVWIALYSMLSSAVDLYHADFLYLKDLTAADPYMLLPSIVTAIMLVQQRMMPVGNMDPAQAQMLRWMPLMFGLMMFGLPSGLVLYIFVNTLLGILQQAYIKRTYQAA